MDNAIYYKLAVFVPTLMTFKDGKRAYNSEAEARADAKAAGTYRISTVTAERRTDGVPFEVAGAARGGKKREAMHGKGRMATRARPFIGGYMG